MKNKKIKFIFFLFLPVMIVSCAHKKIDSNQLKSVQVFKKNSGSNYIFVSNNLQDKK